MKIMEPLRSEKPTSPVPCATKMAAAPCGAEPGTAHHSNSRPSVRHQCCAGWSRGMGSTVLAQVKAHPCVLVGTLAQDGALDSKEYTTVLSGSIKGFENRFQDCQENLFMFVTPFSADKNTWPARVQMECIELQSKIELKDLLSFRIPATREKYLSLLNHTLFV